MVLRADALNASSQPGKTRRANRPHRLSASGAKSGGRFKTGNLAPLAAHKARSNVLKARRLRAARTAKTRNMRLPALTGVEKGAPAPPKRRIGRRVRWRGEPKSPHAQRGAPPPKRRAHKRERATTAQAAPPKQERKHTTADGRRRITPPTRRQSESGNAGQKTRTLLQRGCPKRRRPHRTEAEHRKPHLLFSRSFRRRSTT